MKGREIRAVLQAVGGDVASLSKQPLKELASVPAPNGEIRKNGRRVRTERGQRKLLEIAEAGKVEVRIPSPDLVLLLESLQAETGKSYLRRIHARPIGARDGIESPYAELGINQPVQQGEVGRLSPAEDGKGQPGEQRGQGRKVRREPESCEPRQTSP